MKTTIRHSLTLSLRLFICLGWYAMFFASSTWAATADSTQADVRAVLVTGASSGIGRNIAERLAASGFIVYAGARKQTDIDALNAIENIQAIRLDVTVQDEIDAAVQTVTQAGHGLYGLVNNAGVGVLGPLIEVEEKDLQFVLDVNVYGPYRVTRAFAPLIIESKGRITNIGSVSGIVSGALYGPYSMSKHAIEAYTDSLAEEMAKFGVAVNVVDPGGYRTSIRQNSLETMKKRDITGEGTLFEAEMKGMLDVFQQYSDEVKAPDQVTDAVVHALFDPQPLQRYLVVPNTQQADMTIRQMLRETAQLNQWHAYSYDRDQLIQMLDEVLAEHPPRQ
jgi:NAD(P)-dependent dehydrogenase (short-subunit alcohol dehydrogenase family)